MNATYTNEARLGTFGRARESADSVRFVQNALLSEWPGAVFGLLTLGYIVSSLLSLI